MPIAERAFEHKSINEFKGLDLVDDDYNSYGGDEAVAKQLINFNLTPEGFLQRRKGIGLFATLFQSGGNALTVARYCGTIRDITVRVPWLYFTDNNTVYRVSAVNASVTQEVKMEVSNLPAGGLNTIVQNGSPPSNIYNGTGISSINGVIGVYGNRAQFTNGWSSSGGVKGTYGIGFKNRLWIINTPLTNGDENRVFFSTVGNFTDYVTGGSGGGGNFYVDFGDGDFISSIIAYNDSLLIFKTRKTYSLNVEGDPSSWIYRLVSDRIGCVGTRTVKNINGMLYFLSTDGVYKTDGTTFQIISEPVNDLLQGYRNYGDPNTVMNVSASYWDNKYILWLPRDSAVLGSDQAIVFDILTEQWSVWNMTGTGISTLGEFRLMDGTTDKLFLGSGTNNKVWVMDNQYQDNGLPVTCTWQGRRQDFGDPMNKKRNHLVSAMVSRDANAGEQSVRVKLGTISSQLAGGSVSGQLFAFSVPGSITGVEFYTPVAPGTGNYEIAIWSTTGTTQHRLYFGPLSEFTAGWHRINFPTPFPIVVTTPIPTSYMISVGYPTTTDNIRGFAGISQASVGTDNILNLSNNIIYALLGQPTGFPSSSLTGNNNVFAMLTPIFMPTDVGGVTIEVVADDTTTVTTPVIPVARISDRLIKARGAGYGRYFQTKVTQVGIAPFTLYGLTWSNETRGIQPNSGPNRNV